MEGFIEALLVVLQLFCGLAIFLYGMDVMGDALKKAAGNKLKTLLEKMTSNPIKGFLLGLIVTAVIQSSSATTVMVVGFVNSGTMTLLQSVGVIIGANLGTAVTAWLTAPAAMGQEVDLTWTALLKTDAWMPVLAVIGVVLIMFSKRNKKRDVGTILIGFAVLMVGMELMSDSVKGIDKEVLGSILTIFENPVLGVLAGLVLTVIVQSSSASVGILQTLTIGGAMKFGMAMPIIVGQNIGTCVTAVLSSISANKNGKRAAIIHLTFNVVAALIVLPLFYLANFLFSFVDISELTVNAWWIAGIHTVYKIIAIAIIFPFYKWLEKISRFIVRDNADANETTSLLDERLFETPSIAVGRATDVTYAMADIAYGALKDALATYDNYDAKLADGVRELEGKADTYEDALGSYLVKLSACDMDMQDSAQITKLLHLIGDLERISDHAVNIVEAAEEKRDKNIEFSSEAQREIGVLKGAVGEILDLTYKALVSGDIKLSAEVEPLEQVIDDLRDQIKLNHVLRLQKSECTIEHGFILSDILNDFERVSDHCSNIAGCIVEISQYEALDMHKYLNQMKDGSEEFDKKYREYKAKYVI